jgi:protein transport protein SEC61 subunit alpha
MGINLLYILEPISRIVPTIQKPLTAISMREKTIFTAAALFIYLICCQIPLYGIIRSQNSDPFYWTRVILASSRGTLMELGISPIISAGWTLQFAGLTGLFKVDRNSKRDAQIYEGL